MPTYDYECAACRQRFEVVHGVHADGPGSCPLCGEGPVRKVITAANVHYKGSGWAKKERRATVGSGAAKAGTDGDAPGSDDGSKSDTAVSGDGDSSASTKKEPPASDGSPGKDARSPKPAEKSSTAAASKTAD